mmetsp:Transcript_19392/g.41293  ORF Transcript_19392/g.41293 Transcript_19392/m.41293 type:complete len:265 (-) Transcript_19392:1165-1959(-)
MNCAPSVCASSQQRSHVWIRLGRASSPANHRSPVATGLKTHNRFFSSAKASSCLAWAAALARSARSSALGGGGRLGFRDCALDTRSKWRSTATCSRGGKWRRKDSAAPSSWLGSEVRPAPPRREEALRQRRAVWRSGPSGTVSGCNERPRPPEAAWEGARELTMLMSEPEPTERQDAFERQDAERARCSVCSLGAFGTVNFGCHGCAERGRDCDRERRKEVEKSKSEAPLSELDPLRPGVVWRDKLNSRGTVTSVERWSLRTSG